LGIFPSNVETSSLFIHYMNYQHAKLDYLLSRHFRGNLFLTNVD